VLARASLAEDHANANAQFYQLQTAFHSAASIHNPDGLETDALLQQRVTDTLRKWMVMALRPRDRVGWAFLMRKLPQWGVAHCAVPPVESSATSNNSKILESSRWCSQSIYPRNPAT